MKCTVMRHPPFRPLPLLHSPVTGHPYLIESSVLFGAGGGKARNVCFQDFLIS